MGTKDIEHGYIKETSIIAYRIMIPHLDVAHKRTFLKLEVEK